MSNIDDNVVPVLYALMALEQDVTISELAVGAQNRSMPEADTETPEWFAAATESVDLLAMAPELREIPEDSSDGEGLTSSASTPRRCQRSDRLVRRTPRQRLVTLPRAPTWTKRTRQSSQTPLRSPSWSLLSSKWWQRTLQLRYPTTSKKLRRTPRR